MFLKFLPFQGPLVYRWADPDTGRQFQSNTKQSLMERITAYRQTNNLEEIEHLSFVLENYWCGLPENEGKCVKAEVKRGFLGYVKGGIALIKNIAYDKMVSLIEANKRADQCASCKYNVFPDKKGFIAWSDQIAEAAVGLRKTEKHNELGNCEVCSCPLRAKVFYGGDIKIENEWRVRMEEVKCWQLKGKNG